MKMPALRSKPAWLTLIVIGLGVSGILVLCGNASAESTDGAPPPPFMSYTPPTGPEMTTEEAADSAVKFARIKAGQAPAYGKSMALVINAHAGAIEGLGIGGAQNPALTELSATTRFSYGPLSNTAQAAAHSEPPPHGILAGRVKVRHWTRTVSGWRIAITNNKPGPENLTQGVKINVKKGLRFRFRLYPGNTL